MKKFSQLYITIILIFLSMNAFAQFDLEQTGLITSKSYELRPVSDMEEILNEFQSESPDKHILVYIHGRGRDATKEFEMLKSLEKRQNVRIVMFRWPSWSSLITRPVDKAQNASVDLREVFYSLKHYKDDNPEIFHNKKVSLFLHSMGNIVLEEFTRFKFANDLNSPRLKLFNNIALLGADVGLYNHREWLSKVNFADRKYVAMNNQDIVLNLSNLLDFKNKEPIFMRLGLGFDKWQERKYDIPSYLDKSTVYIDLSRSLRLDHRYFDSQKPKMSEIFGPMMEGEPLDFDLLRLTRRFENGINYLID